MQNLQIEKRASKGEKQLQLMLNLRSARSRQMELCFCRTSLRRRLAAKEVLLLPTMPTQPYLLPPPSGLFTDTLNSPSESELSSPTISAASSGPLSDAAKKEGDKIAARAGSRRFPHLFGRTEKHSHSLAESAAIKPHNILVPEGPDRPNYGKPYSPTISISSGSDGYETAPENFDDHHSLALSASSSDSSSEDESKNDDVFVKITSANREHIKLLEVRRRYQIAQGPRLKYRQTVESPVTKSGIRLAIYLGLGSRIPASNMVLTKGFDLIVDPAVDYLWNKIRSFPEEIDKTHWLDVYNNVINSDATRAHIETFSMEHQASINFIAKQYLAQVKGDTLIGANLNTGAERIIYYEASVEKILKRWLFFFKPMETGKVNWDELIPGEKITRKQGMAELIHNSSGARLALNALYFDIKIRDEDDCPPAIKSRRPIQPFLLGPPGVGKTHIVKRFAAVTGYDLVIIDAAGARMLTKENLFGSETSRVADFANSEDTAFGVVPAGYMRSRKRFIILFDNIDTRAFSDETKRYGDEPSPAQLLQGFFDRKNTCHMIGSLGDVEMDLSECIIFATSNFEFTEIPNTEAIEDRFMICPIEATDDEEKARRAALYSAKLPKKYSPDRKEVEQLLELLQFIVANDKHTPGSRQTEAAYEMAVSSLMANRERLDKEGNNDPLPFEVLKEDIKKGILRILNANERRAKAKAKRQAEIAQLRQQPPPWAGGSLPPMVMSGSRPPPPMDDR